MRDVQAQANRPGVIVSCRRYAVLFMMQLRRTTSELLARSNVIHSMYRDERMERVLSIVFQWVSICRIERQ